MSRVHLFLRFGYGQLSPLRPACGQSRAGSYAGSDFPHPIWFRSSKEGPDHIVKKPSRIRSGWPGQALAERIWTESKLVCKNHRARFWQNANRPATISPLPDSAAFLHRRPGSYCEKPARTRFGSGCVSDFGQ